VSGGARRPDGSRRAGQLPLGVMTFCPQASAVRSARRFVEDQLVSAGLGDVADDAGLLTSELASNAVLHARTGFVVVVDREADGARVEVRDQSDVLPVFTAPSATAMSGRGLVLVQTLAAAWGSEALEVDGKLVWFSVVRGPVAVDPDLSVEDLLAAWADDEAEVPAPDPRHPVDETSDERRDVVAVEVPARELLAAKEHMDDLLRELQLVLLGAGDQGEASGSRPERAGGVLALARRLDAAARAFDDVRRQVREQVSRAVVAGQDRVTLRLEVPPGGARAAVAYREAVEAAETLARAGDLLTTTDSLGRHGTVRRSYLDQLIAQAGHR